MIAELTLRKPISTSVSFIKLKHHCILTINNVNMKIHHTYGTSCLQSLCNIRFRVDDIAYTARSRYNNVRLSLNLVTQLYTLDHLAYQMLNLDESVKVSIAICVANCGVRLAIIAPMFARAQNFAACPAR